MTRLASGLPKGDGNGLNILAPKLLNSPSRIHVVLMLVDCKSFRTDVDSGDIEPTARIRRAEVILPEDRGLAHNMLQRALDKRLGKEVLPYDMEQDIRAAFEGVDPSTGEIEDDA